MHVPSVATTTRSREATHGARFPRQRSGGEFSSLPLHLDTELALDNNPPFLLSSAGPDGTDWGELHHRPQCHHRGWRGCGGRREDKTLHGAEGSAGPIALLAGELHRGVELLRWPVGE